MSDEFSRFLIGGIALFILASPFLFPGGSGGGIYLNGERLKDLETYSSDGKLQVPLKEAVRLLGGEVKRESSGVSSVRWGRGEKFYLTSFDLIQRGKGEYVSIVKLAENMGADVRRMSGGIYLNTDRANLLNSDIGGRKVNLLFDRYVPYTIAESGDELLVRFYNVEPFRESKPVEDLGYIESASFSPDGENELVLRLDLSGSLNYLPENFRKEDGKFGLSLSLGLSSPGLSTGEDVKASSRGPVYRKYSVRSGGVSHTVHSLKIPDWQENYKLEVALADGNVGERSRLFSLMKENSGVAAINGNFFDPSTGLPIGVLVREGDLLSKNWGSRGVLAVDYFEGLGFLRPETSLLLRSDGGKIEVTDLNRPAGSDDLIVFTSNYEGEYSSRGGVPKTVVVFDDGEVKSKLDSRNYIPDYFGFLAVATGDKRRILRSLSPGDDLKFDWRSGPSLASARSALSAGPILIEEGRNALNLREEDFDYGSTLVNSSASRSVVATTREGDLLFLLIDDSGVSLTALPELLLSTPLDIRSAMALDGGSSAGLVFRSSQGIKKIGGNRRIPVGLVVVPEN